MASADVRRVADAIVAALARGDELLLLSDYDGTLAPITEDPVAARLPSGIRDVLHGLAHSDRVCLGIVSGRRLDDLRSQVRVSEVIYAGCQGLEVDGPGISFRHPGATAGQWVLRDIAERLAQGAAGLPGVVVESKGLALSVHYRRVPGDQIPRLLALVARSVFPWRDRIRILRGTKALEILPIRGWDKGRCVAWLLGEVATGSARRVFTIYLGDDETDELVFGSLTGDGITVRVGESPSTLAAYRLAGVDEVHGLLSSLVASIG